MARIKRNPEHGNVGGATPTDAGWKQPSDARFINVYINEQDTQWLLDNRNEQLDVIDELFTFAHKDAARISVVPDAKSGRFNATYTSFDSSSPRYGYIMSVRGATPAVALYALAYACQHKVDAWKIGANDNTGLFN